MYKQDTDIESINVRENDLRCPYNKESPQNLLEVDGDPLHLITSARALQSLIKRLSNDGECIETLKVRAQLRFFEYKKFSSSFLL